ncbi:hypothetical protein BTN50_1625 (plasmid) [Candidatus Enterovibrio altilux]|uniref:Uncharacterized protein n=1 Tax=Candidatus Enterovibrio altilux TaxID=1927128 RepID=A0A291BAN3_9GAMM|nr:hypothetical protein BTN50_1625 [Candidatus Enterovibrio luxaltus]
MHLNIQVYEKYSLKKQLTGSNITKLLINSGSLIFWIDEEVI